MSYTSESVLAPHFTLLAATQLIELLGYKKVVDGRAVPDRKASYFWFDTTDYRSYVGIELDIYKSAHKPIIISTRSRANRSYWDLVHQNHTLKLIRDLLGGMFFTDAGRNRYWRPEEPPPLPVASGCYLAYWAFGNALINARNYLQQRGLDQSNTNATGLPLLDQFNPRLFSNNLLLPYLVAIWEDYFTASFTALLKYSNQREAVLKKAKVSHDTLQAVSSGSSTVEEALSELFSFQRPSIISANFSLIDSKLDLAGTLRKPYRRRRQSLYNSVEAYVEQRNEFVHTGSMDFGFADVQLKKCIKDFEVSVERCYAAFGKAFGFTPLRH